MQINTINPATDQALMTYTAHSDDEVRTIIDAAHSAFGSWRDVDIQDRANYLLKVADTLESDKQKLSKLIAQEMGKVVGEAEKEIDKCAWVCRYYAENAAKFLADEVIASDADESYVSFDPIGVVLAVMPWNFPFWQVFRFAAPALAAGNVCILKHASNVSGCALAIERVFQDAGLPSSLFNTLLIKSDQVAEVIANDKVRAVTLTGSTAAGRAVGENSGKALKKVVLELGGSDAYIVLEDADIDAAAQACADSRLLNCGQSCIGAKRFIIVDAVKHKFEDRFVEIMKKASVGDPFDNDTRLGPMARKDLRDELDKQVQDSVNAGAKLLTGGIVPSGEGAFYPATVLTDVVAGMPAFSEELFGPVAAIISVKDEDEAIRVANDSEFGLGSAVFTKNIDRAKAIARKIDAGSCAINDYVKSDPRLPFGGVKLSGHGRELSHYGIKEFVNIKTITVKK